MSTPPKLIRGASVQFEHKDGDKRANLDVIQHFVREAAKKKVDIIAFPECCITGCWKLRKLSKEEFEGLAESVFEGPSCRELADLSIKHRMTIGAGLLEKANDGRIYNTYVVTLPDGKCHRHRKIHAFESDYVSSGSEYTVFDTPYGCKIGVLICYDNNLVENVRITALKGAEILLAPHQTGGCASPNPNIMGLIDRRLWENRHNDPEAIEKEFRGPKGRGWLTTWLPARAHDNGIFVIFSNGVGPDDDEIRTGNAMIIDCFGRILAETWKAGNDMVLADLDLSLARGSLGSKFIRTRRPELYKTIITPTGLEEDVKKVRFEDY